MLTTRKQQRDSGLEQLAANGIVTDLARLLACRHWAQRLKLFSRQASRTMLLGNARSRFRGRGMEFEEVRRYQPGDDIRTIDWKVSARANGTYTKLFCEERERPCHIVVDQRSHLFFGSTKQFKSVLAAEIAAALGWAALAGGDRVGAQVIADNDERDSRARRNKQAVLRLIHDLHDLNTRLASPPLETTNNTSIANTLEECRRITRPGTAIFVISDFYDFDQSAAKALSNLGKHTDVSLLQITDPLEQQLPALGRVAISDGQQRTKLRVSKSLSVEYQQQLDAQQAFLQISAVRARALFASISTAQSARKELTRLFGE